MSAAPVLAAERSPRRALELVLHLTAREYRIRYRRALLGYVWAVAPPFVRLAVLGVVFTRVLPVGDADYVALLAVGLLGWTWFSAGVANATRAAGDRRELLSQPGLPRHVVPLVSVLTDALDYLAALPVLLVVIVIVTGRVPPTAVLLPLLLVLQACLVLGIGMVTSVVDIRLRDTRLAVDLVLAVGFYATPVFYSLETAPAGTARLLGLNPVARLLEAQRDLLVRGQLPSLASWLSLTAVSLGALVVGWLLYARRAGDFLDDL